MARLKLIVILLLLGGLAILWVVGRQSEAGLRVALQEQVDRTAQLKAEQDRLSNLVAQADRPAPNQSLSELLKLRNEVTLLRRQTNELQRLQAQNDQLQAALTNSNARSVSSAATSTPAKPPLAVYPRSTWAFAGYATPEAAFQSLNYAAATGNLDSFLANLTPDTQQDLAKEFEKKTAAEVTDLLSNKLNLNTEVSILSKTEISDHEVVLEILGSAEGMNHPDKLTFQKIDGQWKFSKPSQP